MLTVQERCQWPTVEQTRTDRSSSCAQKRPTGEELFAYFMKQLNFIGGNCGVPWCCNTCDLIKTPLIKSRVLMRVGESRNGRTSQDLTKL